LSPKVLSGRKKANGFPYSMAFAINLALFLKGGLSKIISNLKSGL